jgi:hypothetical protein
MCRIRICHDILIQRPEHRSLFESVPITFSTEWKSDSQRKVPLTAGEETVIDQDLFSRQLYVLGMEAMT